MSETIRDATSHLMRGSMQYQLSLPEFPEYSTGEYIMGAADHQREAKKGAAPKGTRPTQSGDGWKGFVNVELTDAQKPLVKALCSNADHLWTVIWDLVDASYKLTISNDATHNSYNVSMTCRNQRDPNNGLTLTGRGGTVLGAMASFVFKHETLLEGKWSGAEARSPSRVDEDYLG